MSQGLSFMNPNFFHTHSDPNSSSLAHLNPLPPGTNPDETPDPNPAPPPPQLHNRAHPQRSPLNPEQDLMDVDTGPDTGGAERESAPDQSPERGLKRARPDTDQAETIEHSEPVYKQRWTNSPEPRHAQPQARTILSPEAIKTELLQAVENGNLDRLQSLVNQTENFKNIFDGKLWKVAVKHGHVTVIDWLSKQVDRLDLPKPKYNQLFEIAAGHGKIDILQWLARQLLVIEGVTYDSDYALTLAALGGHLEVVKYLAGQGCDIKQVSDDGDNALTFAAEGGHLEVVKYLAGQGCDIHQVNTDDENALIYAAEGGHLEVVKYLAGQGCDIHQINNDDENALTLAAKAGRLEVVKYLVEHGCNIHQVGNYRNNALTHAARIGHLEVVKYLAEQGCNIQQLDNDGDNALTLAAKVGHLEIVKFLAEQRCNIQQVNVNGDNALTIAAKDGDLEVVKFLVEHGCNIQQVTNYGDNVLTLAATYGHLDVVKYLAEHGCNIHRANNGGDNALILAAEGGHLGTVQYLVEKGLDINQVNSLGYTALARSMDMRYHDTACDLIMRGANLTIGRPPHRDGYLFRALEIGNTELIKLLIPRCDVSERFHSSGITPLMLAARENLIEVAIPLIQATLQVPNGKALVHEASQIETDPLFKELLNNPFIIDEAPSSYSQVSHEGDPAIVTSIIHHHFSTQRTVLQSLQNQLGSNQSMTPMQLKSAQVGILAELPAWKLTNAIEKIFMRELTASLLPIQERVATFISEDIEVLATQANGWEDTHLVPVIEYLYPSCLIHALSAHPASGIIKELTDKGLYHPIAQRIANAWMSAWVTVPQAAPLLRQDTVARNIGGFIDSLTGAELLRAFSAALRREFDSVGAGVLRINNTQLSEQSKNLYADLIGRQLHLIAQFWRAELS